MKKYAKKYPKGSPASMGNKWGKKPPALEIIEQSYFPEISYLKIKTETLLEKIWNAEGATMEEGDRHVELMGFYFYVSYFKPGEKRPAFRNYTIDIIPVFLKYEAEGEGINEGTIELSTSYEGFDSPGDALASDLVETLKEKEGYFNKGGNYIIAHPVTIEGGPDPTDLEVVQIPKFQTLEFYKEKKRFDFAYISKDEIKLLAIMWKYLLISGGEMRIGTGFSKDVAEDLDQSINYFTIKVEGEEWKGGATKTTLEDEDTDSLNYPQMAFGFACPPTWHNFSDTSKLIEKNGFKIKNYALLAKNVRIQWKKLEDQVSTAWSNDNT